MGIKGFFGDKHCQRTKSHNLNMKRRQNVGGERYKDILIPAQTGRSVLVNKNFA